MLIVSRDVLKEVLLVAIMNVAYNKFNNISVRLPHSCAARKCYCRFRDKTIDV